MVKTLPSGCRLTRDNLIQSMKWLVRGAKEDDSLFTVSKNFIILISSPSFSYLLHPRFMSFSLYFLGAVIQIVGTRLNPLLGTQPL